MAEAKARSSPPDDRQKVTRKRSSRSNELGSPESSSNSGIPCGACKFLRRKCVNGCIFAPHFGSDQGTALFAAVHKVFGASNVSKLLMHLPLHHQHYAVQTISYEAQARLADPVYGCVSTIIALQQQIATLKMELATVQNKLINNRLMVATALQGSLQQPELVNQYDLQPVFSSGPSASNNSMINMDIFDSSLDNFVSGHQTAVQSQESQPSFDPQYFQPSCKNNDYNEEEGGDLFAFADQLLQSR